MTLVLIPIGLVMNYVMFSIGREMFRRKELRVRTNIQGFLIYVLGYSLIMQPVSVAGYFEELINMKKAGEPNERDSPPLQCGCADCLRLDSWRPV